MRRLYTPPPGYYDQPFTYIFDASGLTDGQDARNQFVDVQTGLGAFILRRILGLDRVLSPVSAGTPPHAGQFQIRDRYGANLQSQPVNIGAGGAGASNNSGQIGVLPEQEYPEGGAVRFDLLKILRSFIADNSGGHIIASQIAFQGVRRLPGKSPLESDSRYKPKYYVYRLDGFLPIGATASVPAPTVQLFQPIDDYDFELYDVIITYQSQASGQLPGPG